MRGQPLLLAPVPFGHNHQLRFPENFGLYMDGKLQEYHFVILQAANSISVAKSLLELEFTLALLNETLQ
jgi:hypothetical protein